MKQNNNNNNKLYACQIIKFYALVIYLFIKKKHINSLKKKNI